MTPYQDRPTHAKTLTEFDEAHGHIYLFVLDADAAGHDWKFMADRIWEDEQPEDAETIIGEFLKRARWMTTTGYKLMLAMDPTPREESLDGLVASVAMSQEERSFLDSPEGEHIWPRPKH